MYSESNNRILDLSKISLNMIGDYHNTEFYPKNHVFCTGDISVTTDTGKLVDVSICIMKLNKTSFTALRGGSVDGSTKCQELYATDDELINDYEEEMTPESVLITLVCELNLLDFKVFPYISDEIDIIDDIHDSKSFNYELQRKIGLLIQGDTVVKL